MFAEVDKYLFDLLMINAIADSVIYTVRIREVRVGLATICKCCPLGTSLSRESTVSSRHDGSVSLLSAKRWRMKTSFKSTATATSNI
jgi:hypothetical protein